MYEGIFQILLHMGQHSNIGPRNLCITYRYGNIIPPEGPQTQNKYECGFVFDLTPSIIEIEYDID